MVLGWLHFCSGTHAHAYENASAGGEQLHVMVRLMTKGMIDERIVKGDA